MGWRPDASRANSSSQRSSDPCREVELGPCRVDLITAGGSGSTPKLGCLTRLDKPWSVPNQKLSHLVKRDGPAGEMAPAANPFFPGAMVDGMAGTCWHLLHCSGYVGDRAPHMAGAHSMS